MSDIRVYVPRNLELGAIERADRILGYVFSAACKSRTLKTVILISRDRRSSAGASTAGSYPCGGPVVVSSLPTAADTNKNIPSALQPISLQLETAFAGCHRCHIIYYDRPVAGMRHYGTISADSALSDALNCINHQHFAPHSTNVSFGMLQALVAAGPGPAYTKAHGSMLYNEFRSWTHHRAGCKQGCCDEGNSNLLDVAAANRALLQSRQRLLAAIVQHAAGMCLAALLMIHQSECCAGIECVAAYIRTRAVEEQVEWLMGAPAGLKLHIELSHFLGSMAQFWLRCSAAAYVLIGKNTLSALIGLTALAGVIGGCSLQLAFLHDLTCLLSVPLWLAYMAYTKLYAIQLHYTLLMWRLMRGNRDALAMLRKQYGFEASPKKRKQKLREGNEEDGLALEQMIVGVLLFTPLLFLLPTTSVYYLWVLMLHASVGLGCWVLQTSSELLHSNPAYSLWCWVFKPGMMPGAIAFVPTPGQLQLPGLTRTSHLTVLWMVQKRCSLRSHAAQVLEQACHQSSWQAMLHMLHKMSMGELVACADMKIIVFSPIYRLYRCYKSWTFK